MNSKNIFKMSALFVALSLMLSSIAFAQVTRYVNSTNGDDQGNNGLAPVQTAPGVGPYKTIATAITASSDGDIISIAAGAYPEGTIAVGKSVTLVSTNFLSSNVVNIANGITINGAGKTVNLGRTTDGSLQFNLGSSATALTLTAGTLNVDANTILGNGATVTRTNGVLVGTPTITTNVNVVYGASSANITAGPELPAALGSGSLTVNNGGRTVTFPNSLSTSGGITITAGSAVFNGGLTLTTSNLVNNGSGTVTVGGNVAMNGTTSVAAGNISNTSTGTLTINGTITFDSKIGNAPGTITNTGTGTLNANGAVNWVMYATSFAGAGYAIDNSNAGAGTMSLTGGVTFTKASTGGASPAAAIRNNGTGTLTISTVGVTTATISSTAYTPVVSATNASTGTLTFTGVVTIGGTLSNGAAGTVNLAGGTITGNVTNDNGGTIALTAGTTFAGDLSNNNAASVIKLNANTLTLSKAAGTVTNGGKIISATAATVGNGIVALTGGATVNGGGELPNVTVGANSTIGAAANVYGNLTVNAGTLTVNDAGNASTVVKGNVALNGGGITFGTAGLSVDGNYTQAAGTLAMGARTLAMKGNVTMTAGSVTPGSGTLSFVSGTAAQTFTPLPNLALYNLTVNSAGQVVTLAASLVINHDVNIAAGKIDLSTNNIRMQGAGGTFTNTGGYTSSGGGTLIFEAAGTITGAGTFSNIDIRTGGATVVALGSPITVSGIVYLRTGDLDLAGNNLTLNSSLVRPSIFKNTLPGAGTASIVNSGGAATVSVGTDYDLTYYGAANWPAASFGSEWVPAKLHSLTIGTGSAAAPFTVTPPAGAITITGNLVVNANQTLDLANAGTLTAGTASATHSIVGAIANGGFVVSGNSATVGGAAGNTGAELATVNDLTISGTGVGVTNLKAITGNLLITGAGANVVMNTTAAVVTGNITVNMAAAADAATVNMASTTSTHSGNLVLTNGTLTYTRGAAAQQNIGGAVTLTAGTLILGSNVNVTGATTIAAGNLDLGANTYTQLGSGASPDFNRTGAGSISGTGVVKFDATAAAIDVAPGATFTVPNVTIVGAANGVTLNAAMTISGALVQTSGVLTLGGDLTYSGNAYTFTAGSIGGAGVLVLTGSAPTITAAADMSVNGGITVNSAGTVLLRSDKETASTPVARTFTSAGAFTQTAGDIDLGINSLTVTGPSFTRVAGNWTMTSGNLTLNAAGIVFTPGAAMSVKNLTVGNTMTLGGTDAFTVTGAFSYANAITLGADNKLVLGEGATIVVANAAATLDKLPAFPATNNYNVTYNAAVTTAKELSATVNNLTTTAAVTLNAPVTVNGTLAVGGALTNATAKNVTFGPGGILEMNAGGSLAVAIIPPASGVLNIVYNGVATTSNNDWPSSANVGAVTFKAATNLHADRTVQGTLTINGGNLDLGPAAAHTLTVQGDVVVSSNHFFASTTAGSNVVFAGSANTAFTLNATKVVPANVNIKIAKAAKNNTVTLSGGNLNFATNSVPLYFENGLLVTGSQVVILKQSNAGGQPVQGFDRSGVTGSNESHVVGNVRKFIDRTDAVGISRVEFPVGSSSANPYYRPFITYFKTAPASSINLTVSHVDKRAGGSNGFPLTAGTKVITNYPDFYWYASSDVSLNPSYAYDLEAQAKGYTDYITDQIQNVRFVRRDSGSVANPWILQGSDVNYDNSTIATIWPVVKVIDATGGITSQGSIFTYSQGNKPPVFTSAPGNMKSNEGDTLNVTITSADPDMNQTATISLVSAPTGATFNAATGKLTWAIPYTLVTAAEGKKAFSFTFRTTDNSGAGASRDTTFVDTVYNVNRAPSFVNKLADKTIKDSTNALSFQYTATDVDGDTYTFSLAAGAPAGVSITPAGLLTWTPTFVQSSKAGMPYTVKVYVADANGLKDSTTATVTVVRLRAKGDINGDATVGTADATIALQAAVGTKTFTMPADTIDFWAGDVTGNGTVSALDASYILRKVAGDTVTFAPKMAKAYNGTVEFGKVVSGSNGVTIPVKISNAENVTAVTFTVNVDSKVASFEGTKTTLPKDWIVMSSNNNGVVTVAMAGITPINSGDVAAISISLKEKEARISVNGSGFVNEAASQSLSLDNVRMMPSEYALDQNYPNPFNPSTTIKYQLTEDSKVNLTIYNLQGQVVRTLVNDNVAAGFQSVTWNGRNEMGQQVASGMYMYRIQAGSFVSVKKMLMLK